MSNLSEILKYFLRGFGERIDLSDVDYLVYIGMNERVWYGDFFIFFVGVAIQQLNGIADSQGKGIH